MLKFFDADPDPGSRIILGRGIRDGIIRIRDNYPGSATLVCDFVP
jgi:hypothetical protein